MEKYRVTLTAEERATLEHLVSAGKAAARKLTHARILLLADTRGEDSRRRRHRRCPGHQPADRRSRPPAVRHRGAPGGHRPQAPTASAGQDQDQGGRRAEADPTGLQRPSRGPLPLDLASARRRTGRPGPGPHRLDGDGAAGAEKNDIEPWIVETWCIPPKADAEYVWRMEDVIQTYLLPYDPAYPVVCFDEACKQLFGEVRAAAAGPARQPGQAGLRVRAQGRLQPVDDVRAAAGLAACQGERAADPDGLRRVRAGVGGGALPQGQEDPPGAGQPEHPRRGQPL